MLLVSGRFPFLKTIIPEAKEHFLARLVRRDTHLFGGLGINKTGRRAQKFHSRAGARWPV